MYKYMRIQGRDDSYITKYPKGIFSLCWNLIKDKVLTAEEEQLFISIDEWFKAELPEPEPCKNHETVIRAIAGTDLLYVIVGKGNLSDKLMTIAKENKVDLRLMGYREDIADFYDAADVYILASKREGLNVSLMEAMAHGLSVTCSRIRGNMDLIDRPLFSPKAAVEMREAIAEAIEHREEYGKRNAEIIKNFDLSIVNYRIDKVYCMEKNESYESN